MTIAPPLPMNRYKWFTDKPEPVEATSERTDEERLAELTGEQAERQVVLDRIRARMSGRAERGVEGAESFEAESRDAVATSSEPIADVQRVLDAMTVGTHASEIRLRRGSLARVDYFYSEVDGNDGTPTVLVAVLRAKDNEPPVDSLRAALAVAEATAE